MAPEIPTIGETLPGYLAVSFNGVVAPAATPPAVIAKLNATITDILRSPQMQADVERLGGLMDIGSADDFAKFIAREAVRWREVADANNIKVD